MINLGGDIYAKIVDFIPLSETSNDSFHSGMVFEFPVSETELKKQASVTMHFLHKGTIFRIETQEFLHSLQDWRPTLLKRAVEIRSQFLKGNP